MLLRRNLCAVGMPLVPWTLPGEALKR